MIIRRHPSFSRSKAIVESAKNRLAWSSSVRRTRRLSTMPLTQINASMNTSDHQEPLKWSFQTISVLAICSIITILTLLGKSSMFFQAKIVVCLSRQWFGPALGEISSTCSILLRLFHCQSVPGGLLCRSVCHAIDDGSFLVSPLAISLPPLLSLDVDRFYLFDSILSYTRLDGTGSILGFNRYPICSFRLHRCVINRSSSLLSSTQSILYLCFGLHRQFMGYSLRYLAKFDLRRLSLQDESAGMCPSGTSVHHCYPLYIFLLYSTTVHACMLFKNYCQYQKHWSSGKWMKQPSITENCTDIRQKPVS